MKHRSRLLMGPLISRGTTQICILYPFTFGTLAWSHFSVKWMHFPTCWQHGFIVFFPWQGIHCFQQISQKDQWPPKYNEMLLFSKLTYLPKAQAVYTGGFTLKAHGLLLGEVGTHPYTYSLSPDPARGPPETHRALGPCSAWPTLLSLSHLSPRVLGGPEPLKGKWLSCPLLYFQRPAPGWQGRWKT